MPTSTTLTDGQLYRLSDGRHVVAFAIDLEEVRTETGLTHVLYQRHEWPIQDISDLEAAEDGAILADLGTETGWHVSDLTPTGVIIAATDEWPDHLA